MEDKEQAGTGSEIEIEQKTDTGEQKPEEPTAEIEPGTDVPPEAAPLANENEDVDPPLDKIAELEDALFDKNGVTGTQLLSTAVRRLRKEHTEAGGGNNTPLSKAITFAATAVDLLRAL